MREFGVKGATDVTGFALIGHAWEMAKASGVTIELDARAVPLLEGALELATAGLLTSGDKSNRAYVSDEISVGPTVDEFLLRLLYDPQTAGGMLLAVTPAAAEDALARLRENYPRAAVIGKVTERQDCAVVIE
jgi:selenide,water dikinase